MPNRGSALQTYYFVPTFARASTKSTLLLPTRTLLQPDWGAFSTLAHYGQKYPNLPPKVPLLAVVRVALRLLLKQHILRFSHRQP